MLKIQSDAGGAAVAGKQIVDIRLSEGALIGLLNRDGDSTIPVGSVVLEPKARMLALTGTPELAKVRRLLEARAGYDPPLALGVWQRMAALPNKRPPAFLSTHPETEARLQDIEARFLPQAMEQLRAHPDAGHRPLAPPEQINGLR